MTRTQIYLTQSQIAELDRRAAARGVTRSDLIREAVDRELSAETRKMDLFDVIAAHGGAELEGFEERSSGFRASLDADASRARKAMRRGRKSA